MQIDFIVYQLQHFNNKVYTEIPGVLVERAAKTTHRHRNSNLLAMQLSFSGKHSFQGDEIEQLLKKASGIFFHAQGSVTHAMQLVIEYLNKQIYEKNADWGYEGLQALGSINIAVFHNGGLFIGQAGDAHIFHIGTEVYERFGDEGETTEKLGVSRRLQPRYYQCGLAVGDMLIMTPKSHGSWKSYYLAGSNSITVDLLKRRLHNQMIQDFSALVIKIENGSGKVRWGEWAEAEPNKIEEIKTEGLVAGASREKSQEILTVEVEPDPIELYPLEEPTVEEAATLANNDSGRIEDIIVSLGETERSSLKEEPDLVRQSVKQKEHGEFIKSIAKLWMWSKTTRAKIQLLINRIRRKLFPNRINSNDRTFDWRGAAALAIPVIFIVTSLFVYTSYGKEEQYNIFMTAAREKASLAETTDDATLQKELWAEALDCSIKAEDYQVTNESRQLFQQAQAFIDGVDLTSRLDFRPAMTQALPEGVSIRRIKEGTSGIYLLDSRSGNVLRAYVNSKGFYELDEAFKCAPGSYGLVDMGDIVDFIVLPANSKGYKVMAIDTVGNLLYCQPGEVPDSRTLTVPEGGWGKINGVLYSEKWLYVVDPVKNDIWIYKTNSESTDDLEGIVFVETPISFFDEDVPDLGGAKGVVLNQEDLYVLHEDGHMTMCQYGHEKVRLTTCEDPAPFTDDRVSSENKKPWIFMGTHFIAVNHSVLPNNSIYLLDDISGALYRFSMQLNLESTLKPQINPDFPLPETAPSGFGITLDQEVLLAYDNQLFTAPLR